MAKPVRAANGRFVKRKSSSSSSTALARRPSSSPAVRRRRSSSPYVTVSRRRRATGTGSPVKKVAVGAGLGLATTKFRNVYEKLPEIGGTRMVALAGIAHVAKGKIPHGQAIADGSAYIAGWELGKANAGKLGISGSGDDEF